MCLFQRAVETIALYFSESIVSGISIGDKAGYIVVIYPPVKKLVNL